MNTSILVLSDIDAATRTQAGKEEYFHQQNPQVVFLIVLVVIIGIIRGICGSDEDDARRRRY